MQVGYSVAQVYTLWSHCWGHLADSGQGNIFVWSWDRLLPPSMAAHGLWCSSWPHPSAHLPHWFLCMHVERNAYVKSISAALLLFKVQTSDHQVFINCSFCKSSYYSLFSQKILHWRRASSVLQHSCHCFLPVLGTLEPSVVFRSLHTSCPLIYLWVKGLLSSKTELPFSPEHQ